MGIGSMHLTERIERVGKAGNHIRSLKRVSTAQVCSRMTGMAGPVAEDVEKVSWTHMGWAREEGSSGLPKESQRSRERHNDFSHMQT